MSAPFILKSPHLEVSHLAIYTSTDITVTRQENSDMHPFSLDEGFTSSGEWHWNMLPLSIWLLAWKQPTAITTKALWSDSCSVDEVRYNFYSKSPLPPPQWAAISSFNLQTQQRCQGLSQWYLMLITGQSWVLETYCLICASNRQWKASK